MRQALVDCARGRQFAILFLDLDRFKAVNDMLGHDAGDELLRKVAKRLAETVRKEDTVARIGGDEFVVLETGISGPEDATQLARQITKSVGEPYRIGETRRSSSALASAWNSRVISPAPLMFFSRTPTSPCIWRSVK